MAKCQKHAHTLTKKDSIAPQQCQLLEITAYQLPFVGALLFMHLHIQWKWYKLERATVIGFGSNTRTLGLINLPLLHNIEPIVTTQRAQNNLVQCKKPIMSEAVYICELCGRNNFKSQCGLSKHKMENKAHRDHLKARFGSKADTKIAAAYLPADAVHKPQAYTAGSQNAMHYPDMANGLGAKRAKFMWLPDKDFVSAWLMKAQSQLEQSQADNDSDSDVGMYEAENDVFLPPYWGV